MSLLSLLSDRCRLCLDKLGTECLFTQPQLVEDVKLCTGVRLIQKDNLPENICIFCIKRIGNAKELKLMTIRNNDRLKELDYECNDDSIENALEVVIAESGSDISLTETDIADVVNNGSQNLLKIRKEIVCSKYYDSQTSSGESSIGKNKDILEQDRAVSTSKIAVRSDLFDDNHHKKRLKKKKTIKPEDYTCEICWKKLKNNRSLYHHMRYHNDKKQYQCPICCKGFTIKSDLDKHVRVHTGEKPYKCDICNKAFTQNSTLKSHKVSVHSLLPG